MADGETIVAFQRSPPSGARCRLLNCRIAYNRVEPKSKRAFIGIGS
jgi:hypothetical protein